MGPHLSSSVFGYTKIISRLKKEKGLRFLGSMQKFFSKGPKKENKKKKKRKKHESVLCLALSPKWLFSLLVWSASYFL